MRDRQRGKTLITGSIAGLMPGSSLAVYNGRKAFLDSFVWAKVGGDRKMAEPRSGD